MRDEKMDERITQLLTAERDWRCDTSTLEAHFETRVMARIRERQAGAIPWYVLAWRMIPVFTVITVISMAFSIALKPAPSRDLFAAITNNQEEYMTRSILTGE